MDLKNVLWTEKYRPTEVEKVISIHTNKILKYLENPSALPNFLFYSKVGGTGKTSMARAIINDLKCDCLVLNASADRSIDNVRTRVKEFARGKSTNNIRRCVFMDEGEKLTKDAMDALKNMIEEYSDNCFYIFTTNNINKINQPMQSRFNCMEFAQPDKSEIENYLVQICDNENVKYSPEGIISLVEKKYPSIRNMVKLLQDCKVQDINVSELVYNNDKLEELWTMIVEKKFNDLRRLIIEEGIDVEELNEYIFYNKAPSLELAKQVKLIQLCAKNERDFNFGCDKNIIFISSIPEMIMVTK